MNRRNFFKRLLALVGITVVGVKITTKQTYCFDRKMLQEKIDYLERPPDIAKYPMTPNEAVPTIVHQPVFRRFDDNEN